MHSGTTLKMHLGKPNCIKRPSGNIWGRARLLTLWALDMGRVIAPEGYSRR